jgi:Domain of unknown function (DUF4389)
MPYPVSVTVVPAFVNRNRLTTFFRFVLAIPHIILVGGVGIGFASQNGDSTSASFGEGGLLGVVAAFLAVVSWLTIVIAGTHIVGIRQFCSFYLRWRTRAAAYLMLLEDAYPPFGDAAYPAQVEIVDPPTPRERLTVAFRIILALPHFFILFFLYLGWCLMTVIAWFAILFSGSYPDGLYEFGVGVLRWMVRVEAYMLLLVDEYPPFSLT